MKLFKKTAHFFVYPPLWLLIPIMLITVIALVVSTVILTQDGFADYVLLGYILLGITVLGLTYTIFGIVKTLPTLKEKTLVWAEKHPLLGRFFTDRDFRSTVMTVITFVINIAFVVYNGSIAVVIHSIWFGALAAYNLVLVIFKAFILIYKNSRRIRKKRAQTEIDTYISDTKCYGISGTVLLLLPICLSFAILQMVRADDSFVHTGITIYVYAIYAFYRIIASTMDLFKARKTKDMIFRSLKNTSLAGALLSILALQTAMFREFGNGMGSVDVKAMNATTGAVVCAITAAIGIFMMINAIRIILKSKKAKTDNNQTEEK